MIYPFWRAKRFVQTPADSTFPPAALHRPVGTIEVAKQHGSPVDSKKELHLWILTAIILRRTSKNANVPVQLHDILISSHGKLQHGLDDWMSVYSICHSSLILSTRPTRTVHTVAVFQLSLAVQLQRHGGRFNGTKGCRKRSPWWRWNGGIFLGCPGTPWNRNLGNQPILRSLRCHLQDRGKMVPCI